MDPLEVEFPAGSLLITGTTHHISGGDILPSPNKNITFSCFILQHLVWLWDRDQIQIPLDAEMIRCPTKNKLKIEYWYLLSYLKVEWQIGFCFYSKVVAIWPRIPYLRSIILNTRGKVADQNKILNFLEDTDKWCRCRDMRGKHQAKILRWNCTYQLTMTVQFKINGCDVCHQLSLVSFNQTGDTCVFVTWDTWDHPSLTKFNYQNNS